MIDDAFTMDADPRRLRQLLARLRTRLASHLAHEEADALPLVSQILSPGELGLHQSRARSQPLANQAGHRGRLEPVSDSMPARPAHGTRPPRPAGQRRW
jgi:hypothetical protein